MGSEVFGEDERWRASKQRYSRSGSETCGNLEIRMGVQGELKGGQLLYSKYMLFIKAIPAFSWLFPLQDALARGAAQGLLGAHIAFVNQNSNLNDNFTKYDSESWLPARFRAPNRRGSLCPRRPPNKRSSMAHHAV